MLLYQRLLHTSLHFINFRCKWKSSNVIIEKLFLIIKLLFALLIILKYYYQPFEMYNDVIKGNIHITKKICKWNMKYYSTNTYNFFRMDNISKKLMCSFTILQIQKKKVLTIMYIYTVYFSQIRQKFRDLNRLISIIIKQYKLFIVNQLWR